MPMLDGTWSRIAGRIAAGAVVLALVAPVHGAERPKQPERRREGPAERFDRMDRNHDGKLTADEVGNDFMFRMLDLDHDGSVTRPEAAGAIVEMETSRRWARYEPKSDGAAPTNALAEAFHAEPAAGLGIGKRIADLEARDTDGRRQRLLPARNQKALVIAVVSSSCPLSGKYAPVLARLESAYRDRGVGFVFVAPVATDTAAALGELRRSTGWKGPLLVDAKRKVASALGVRSTTEVFVCDAAGTLQYRGAIDDQYGLGYARAEARAHPLADAIDAVLEGRMPAVAATSAPGCVVELPAAAPAKPTRVTYHRDIARLMQRHCVECHHEGGLAPFSLERYQDVTGHAGMIRKQVERGAMPPWFAAPGHGVAFANDRSLPEPDRAALLSWLASDRPEGNPRETPVRRRFDPEWAIGKPDAVYQIPQPIAVAAEGVMDYQNVRVETGLTEDRWVEAMEVQPTARSVVHHVLIFALRPGEKKGRRGDDAADEQSGFFAAYVPGNSHQRFPEGFAKRLPAGTVLRFQIHYTPNGKATNDQIRLGVRFRSTPPTHAVHVLGLANPLIEIPPGAARHAEFAGAQVQHEARILTFMPHMHVRGTAFRYDLVSPDGTSRTLLDVPRYDFNWQLSYRCAEPVIATAGSRIRATGWFDNSAGNPANPDPKRVVHWGKQTYEEMMLGYIEYYFPDEVPGP